MPIAIARLLGRAGELPRAQGFALATMLLVVTAVVIISVVSAAEQEGLFDARHH
jgi:hypothetical protein